MSFLPRLRKDVSFFPYDNDAVQEEFVAATPDGRQFRINAVAKQVLEQLDGQTTLDAVAAKLSTPEFTLHGEQIAPILSRYLDMGLLEPAEGESVKVAPRKIRVSGFPFLLAIDILPASWTGSVSRLFKFLFARWVAVLGLAVIAATHVVVYSGPRSTTLISMDEYLWVVLLAVASILIHEIGHASALERIGGKPGAIGFGLFLLMPVFFADVSQLWRFRRGQRVLVDLGGVYFQQLAFAGLAVAYAFSGAEVLRMTCLAIDFMVLMSLNPIFRFDGYWVLVDYLSMPELQRTAVRDLGTRARAFFRSETTPPVPRDLRGLKRVVFHSYSVLAGGFLVVLLLLMGRYVNSAFITLPIILPEAARATWAAAQAGQPAAFAGKALGLFFVVAFPATALVGVGLHVLRFGQWVRGRFGAKPQTIS